MTREEIIAKHDERHLQNALRRVKAMSDNLTKEIEHVREKFPKVKAISDISRDVSTVAASIDAVVQVTNPK